MNIIHTCCLTTSPAGHLHLRVDFRYQVEQGLRQVNDWRLTQHESAVYIVTRLEEQNIKETD